ncbi:MAG: PorT family protein [Lewinellaceae bacterium]|nr:PorT family protein [Phaeodactylibacter sp.]MCB9041529.1 PorT family protein [Lewinellaceae bacterium]
MKNLMFKIVLRASIATLLLGFALNAGAQRIEFGLRFMPTLSSFDVKTSSGGTVKGEATVGFGFGAILGYNFSDHFEIQGEVIYNSLSQKYKELDIERKVKLDYVNIPLLLSLNTGKSKPINFNVVAGPQMGINVGSSLKVSSSGVDTPNALLSVKKGDLGFAYGAGLDFGLNPASNFRLALGFRGVYGLFDISDNNKNNSTDSFFVLDRSHIKTYSGYIGFSVLF